MDLTAFPGDLSKDGCLLDGGLTRIEMTLRHLYPRLNGSELVNKECVVCGLIQSEWDHYQLPCQHYAHTRCLRHWLYAKKHLECPWCQTLTPHKQYCTQCQSWGNHIESDTKCPKAGRRNLIETPVSPKKQHFRKKSVTRSASTCAQIEQSSYDSNEKRCLIHFVQENDLHAFNNLHVIASVYDSVYQAPQQCKKRKT